MQPDFRNTPSTTNLGGDEIVDTPGKDGNTSMPEQVKRPNPWRKMMIYSLNAQLETINSKPCAIKWKGMENMYTHTYIYMVIFNCTQYAISFSF